MTVISSVLEPEHQQMSDLNDPDKLDDSVNGKALVEARVEALRQSLTRWQVVEAEYEGLKEALAEANDKDSPEALEIKLGEDLGGDFVNGKDVRELLGYGKGPLRNRKQIIDALSRRIEYVQGNVNTAKSLLAVAENELGRPIDNVIPNKSSGNDLPIADICETLDEEGNVIATSVSNPGKSHDKIFDALHSVGLSGGDIRDGSGGQNEASKGSISSHSNDTSPAKSDSEPSLINIPSAVGTPESKIATKKLKSAKKKVTFADDVKESSSDRSGPPRRNLGSLADRGSMLELDDEDNVVRRSDFTPIESHEEAELRQEMLAYGLSEVGSVVAELDLEEEDTDDLSADDYSSDETSDDEDGHGRSIRNGLTNAYRQEMLDIQQRHSNKTTERGKLPGERQSPADLAKDVRRLRIQKPTPITETTNLKSQTDPSKKSRVIDDLQGHKKQETLASKETPKKPPKISPAGGENAQPIGQTISDQIIERHIEHKAIPEPDEFDPATMQQEISMEYHRLRNRMIQKQGGFQPSEEEIESPLMEEQDGKVKKVSRFKAARLKAPEI